MTTKYFAKLIFEDGGIITTAPNSDKRVVIAEVEAAELSGYWEGDIFFSARRLVTGEIFEVEE